MDKHFNLKIESSDTLDVSSILQTIFKDHSLKSGSKHSSKNLKKGEIDLTDFESVGGSQDRELFN